MTDANDEGDELPDPTPRELGDPGLPMPHLDPVRSSSAGAGEGVSNPTEMDVFCLSDRDGVPYAALWRWRGEEYDPNTCWFEFDRSSLVRILP